jgi:hypothetical protein
MHPLLRFLLVVTIMATTSNLSAQPTKPGDAFSKDNLVAWCIVPFDVMKRSPEERAQMLERLGLTRLAYDWREEHVSSFNDELDALERHHITLQAFWMPYGPDPAHSSHYQTILSLLERRHVKTQLWWSFGSDDTALDRLSESGKVALVGAMVRQLADDAARLGCTVGLYNHNGWFGEPENELAILNYVNRPNVGIVYNFNHAENQIDRFPDFFPKLLPHLIALNIAGLQSGPPGKVVPVGRGDGEQEMIRVIGQSGFAGPVGIINEDTDPDAERGLAMNIEGLKTILENLGFDRTRSTFR